MNSRTLASASPDKAVPLSGLTVDVVMRAMAKLREMHAPEPFSLHITRDTFYNAIIDGELPVSALTDPDPHYGGARVIVQDRIGMRP